VRILSEIRERMRALFRRGRDEHELDEELRFHLQMQVEEYVRLGMEPAEARRRAAIEFGGVERVKEEVRDARGLGALESVARDVGYAWKSFRSGRSGLLLATAVLALAIGAGSTTFSVVSGVLLHSLPFADPDRLVNVRVSQLDRRTDPNWGATMSRQSIELTLSPGAFESAAYLYGSGQPVLTGRGDPLRVDAWDVGPEFFEVLGARPLLGRTLTRADAEDAEGGSPVVLSHRFWTERFGRSPDAVGQALRLDGRVHTVAGVMPPGFEFPDRAQLWRPASPPSPVDPARIQGGHWLVGRLAPGVTLEQARARMDAHFAAHGREHPGFLKWGPNLEPIRSLITGPVRTPLLLLMGAVALVILIACANVAAVLLARGITRRRELAIRVSMGATRGRVARQLVTEAVLLALVSGACGTVLALAGVPLFLALAGDQIPATARIAVDGRVLAYTLAASTLTGLISGLFPALVAAREDLSAAMRDGSAGSGTGAWLTRMGEGLVVLQVGLGTILMSAAALLAISFANLMNVDYGFDPGQVAAAKVQLSSERYATAEQRRSFVAQVSERARGLPGVQSAAASSGIPFDAGTLGSVEIPGKDVPEAAAPVFFTGVTPGYFRTLGITLLRGRALTPADDSSVVVVNESLVRTYFPGENPIGRTIAYYGGSTRSEIVGVVADTRQQSLAEPAPPQIYTTLDPGTYLHVMIRTAGDAGGAAAALREAIRTVDPNLPLDRLGVMDELVHESAARPRFHAVAASAFALIALLITALGIYGLTAYSVSRRSREIGIRLALGATGKHIYIGTVGRAALLAGGGVVLGLMGAWAGARLLDAFVFGLSTTDPRVFAGVALLLTLAAVAAALAPARRAGRIDPIVVLRTD